MENQLAETIRSKEDGSIHGSDRISELGQPILHQVLSFLSQKEAAQTCLLSKTWRYLGSTRPKIDFCGICDNCLDESRRLGENKIFCESCFGGNEKAFLHVLDKTLQRYHDQKLFTQEFRLKMLNVDPESISLLEKWVPLLVTPYMAVNTFDIRYCHKYLPLVFFDLPSEVFYIKSLEKLYLERCRLNQIDFVDRVIQLNRLQTLSLYHVLIADETLEKIISNCPLIENVALDWCEGLRTVKMINKHPNLKHFCFTYCPEEDYYCQGVEIDAPALETIEIVSCPNWYLHNKYLRNLKSLRLNSVRLSSDFFENFSSKFPCLEELDICYCIHFYDFHLSSRSIKHLTIVGSEKITKATIDAPNILYFKIRGLFPPLRISFTEISCECESLVDMWFVEDTGYNVSLWFVTLFGLLMALGQSQITLKACYDRLPHYETIGGSFEPVVVEHLSLSLASSYDNSSPSLPDFLKGLFRICRPRYAEVHYEHKFVDIPFIGFLFTVLVQERDQGVYHWQQYLEDVEMELWEKNAKEWNPTSLENFRLLNKEKIRFRLKWRD